MSTTDKFGILLFRALHLNGGVRGYLRSFRKYARNSNTPFEEMVNLEYASLKVLENHKYI